MNKSNTRIECNQHKFQNLSKLPLKCLRSIRCPSGHDTWIYIGNICRCYNKDCREQPFCGFCQHKMLCRHNKPRAFWLFALSLNKHFRGYKLADFASPYWESMTDSEKQVWKEKARKTYQ